MTANNVSLGLDFFIIIIRPPPPPTHPATRPDLSTGLPLVDKQTLGAGAGLFTHDRARLITSCPGLQRPGSLRKVLLFSLLPTPHWSSNSDVALTASGGPMESDPD